MSAYRSRRQTSIVGSALLLATVWTAARAGKIELYSAPVGVPASDRFQVEVREQAQSAWRPMFVHQRVSSLNPNRDASWASFSFSGRLELRVTPLQTACRTVVVRPKAFEVPASLVQGQVIIPLDQPRKLAIEINGDADHPLFIFADRPDRPPVKEPGRELVVFEPGPHHIGDRYPLRSQTTYYLHGAAPKGRWFQYSVNEPALRGSAFQLQPQVVTDHSSANGLEVSVLLPARSLSAVSTWELGPEALGVISDEPRFALPKDNP